MQVKVGDKIEIINMINEPNYIGRIGVVEHIDDFGQIHGTWGGCALIPEIDKFKIIPSALERHDLEIEQTIRRLQRAVEDKCWKMAYSLEKHLHDLIKERKLYIKLKTN